MAEPQNINTTLKQIGKYLDLRLGNHTPQEQASIQLHLVIAMYRQLIEMGVEKDKIFELL